MPRKSAELDRPTASVVIPAFNAAATVAKCIDAVLAQDYPRGRFEIVVVDNGSTDPTDEILRAYGDDVIVVPERRRGRAAARNAGIRRARHALIAFLDADCVPETPWLRRLVEAHRANPDADFIGGPVKCGRVHNAIERFSEKCFDHGAALTDPRFPNAFTGNLVVRRSYLLEIGLFDEGMRYGEDTELSFRARIHHNAKFAYAPDAIVYHRNPKTIAALVVQGVKHGRGAAYFLDRYGTHVGETPLARALSSRRWKRIAVNLWQGARLFLDADAARRAESRDCLYDAIFNTAKQSGMLAQAIRNRRKIRPASVAEETNR